MSKPTLKDLGFDLLQLSPLQLCITLTLPFTFLILYFVFAFNDLWPAAIICTIGLSFTSYGSTSHDLVHENLKLSKKWNGLLLSILELACFRSGHAYQVSHLYHHKRYPHEDDVEGAAARMSLWRTLVEGIIFQFKIFAWSLRVAGNKRRRIIVAEGVLVFVLVLACIYSVRYSYVGFVYFILMIAGSWIIPLITSYAVHTPGGLSELHQTKLFRGKFFSSISFHHLYHLEHHLYPMVPHKNWPLLAKRLDIYFEDQGVKPLVFSIKK
jgi:beta-carotene hydroxylase